MEDVYILPCTHDLTLDQAIEGMLSWWGRNEHAEEKRSAAPRTVKTTQVHLEVIGGSSSSAFWDSNSQSSTSRSRPRNTVIGPPRLPSELLTHIYLLAADLLIQGHAESSDLLRLASVDRSAHHAILNHHILSNLRLTGIYQVKSFSRDLQRNVLGLQQQVKRIKKLTIRRGGDKSTLEFMQSSSLFSGVEELAYFEKATLEPLKIILSHCSNIEHLSLDMPARVLDERNSKGTTPRPSLAGSLKELITLLSVYGGDLNEALWSPGSLSLPRWHHLTHLQLHGPRFRMTPLTAMAISQLPSLTHLALIMPLLVQPNSLNQTSTNSMDMQVDNARDALGRCNVLQLLIDAIGHQLQTLLLVCHDIETYVGNVQRLGSWFRALHWRCSFSGEPAKLVLVTAKPRNPQQTTPHPSLYSKWMLQRAEGGTHWDWSDLQGYVGHDSCQEMNLSYSVESWRIPVVRQESRTETQGQRTDEEQRADNDTARRWMGITMSDQEEQDASSDSSATMEELSGIDNLD